MNVTKPTQLVFLKKYLKAVVQHPKYFKTVNKPSVNTKYFNDVNRNTFQTYDDWIYIRYQQHLMHKSEMNDKIIMMN